MKRQPIIWNLNYKKWFLRIIGEDKKCSCPDNVKNIYCTCGFENYNDAKREIRERIKLNGLSQLAEAPQE